MSDDTIHVTIESGADFFEAALEDVRRLEAGEELPDKNLLSLPDEDALERVLSAKNLELIRAIATAEPESLRELSRLVDRDVKNVSIAVNRLEELGLVDLEETGRAKKPTVWYDQIEIDVQVGPANDDESAIAPV